MRRQHALQTAYGIVEIDTVLIHQRDAAVAVGIDHATSIVCGIGADQDPTVAVEKCALDVIHPNGWSPACGVPRMFSLDHAANGCQIEQLARNLNVAICRQPPRMRSSSAELARHLSTLPPAEQFRDHQIHCDSIQWAIINNNSVRRGLRIPPEQAWCAAYERCAIRPYPPALETGAPGLIRVEVAPSGSVEIDGVMYADERIPIVANRAAGEAWIEVVIFPDQSLPAWVIDVGGRAFPIFKRDSERGNARQRLASADTARPRYVDISSLELVPTDVCDGDSGDRNIVAPKSAPQSRGSSHQRWVHDLADEVIEREWLIREGPSGSLVFCQFREELHRRAARQGCDVPNVSLSFFYRKLRRLDPYTVALYRRGLAAARRQFLSARPRIRLSR